MSTLIFIVLNLFFAAPVQPKLNTYAPSQEIAWYMACDQHDYATEIQLAHTDGRAAFGDTREFNSDEQAIIDTDSQFRR